MKLKYQRYKCCISVTITEILFKKHWLFSLAHVLSTNMEEAWFMTYAAASHQPSTHQPQNEWKPNMFPFYFILKHQLSLFDGLRPADPHPPAQEHLLTQRSRERQEERAGGWAKALSIYCLLLEADKIDLYLFFYVKKAFPEKRSAGFVPPRPDVCKSERASLIFFKALYSSLRVSLHPNPPPRRPCSRALHLCRAREERVAGRRRKGWKGFQQAQREGWGGPTARGGGGSEGGDVSRWKTQLTAGSSEPVTDFSFWRRRRSWENLDAHSHLQNGSLMGFHSAERAAQGASRRIWLCILCVCLCFRVHKRVSCALLCT